MNDFRKGFIIFLILIAMVSISAISAADNNIGSVSSNYENNIVTDGEVPISEDTSTGNDYANSQEDPNSVGDPTETGTTVSFTTTNSSKLNEETEIGAQIVAADGQPIAGGNATITISKDQVEVHNDTIPIGPTGIVKFKWTPNTPGIYYVFVKYNGYNNTEKVWNVSSISMLYDVIVGTTTNITSGNSSMVFDPFNITATITAGNGKVLNGTAVFKIFNNKDKSIILEKTIDITEGNFKYTWTPQQTGNYTYTLTFNKFVDENNTEYASSFAEQVFEVMVNNDLNLIVNNVTMYYGDGTKLVVQVLTRAGVPLNNITVNVKINGKNYKINTNAKGLAYLAVNLNPKTYEVVTTIPGTESETNSTLTVNKWKRSLTSLTVKNLVKAYKDSKRLNVVLKHNNVPIAGQTVYVKIAKKTYKIKTNSKGIATLAINFKPGVYTAKVSIKISDFSLTKNAKITVKKWQKKYAKLTTKKLVKDYHDANRLQAVLTYKGDPISNEIVYFTINKKKYYKAKTNSKGIASFKIYQNVGNYKGLVLSKVSGVTLSHTAKFSVQPARALLNRSAPVSWSGTIINGTIKLIPNYKKGSTIYFTFTYNNKPMVSKVVTVCLDKDKSTKQIKKSEIKVTNKKGVIAIPTKNFKLGSHMFYITFYSGDSNFYSLKWAMEFNLQ